MSVRKMSGGSAACSLRLTTLVHFLLLWFVSLSNPVSCNRIDSQDSLISNSGLTNERPLWTSLHASGLYPAQRHSLPHHVDHNSNIVSAKTQTKVDNHVHGLNNFIIRPQRFLTRRGVRRKSSKLIDDISDREVLLEFKGTVRTAWELEGLRSWNSSKNPNVCSGWKGVRCNRARRVVALRLTGMGLTGNISPALGNLSFLTTLDLSDNSFFGSLPSEIGMLANLEELAMALNSLNGTITGLLNLMNLRSLDLSENILFGDIPLQCNNWTNLQSLDLSHNQLTGGIPSQFGALGHLEELILGNNNLNVTTFTALSNWTGLRSLDLQEGQLTGIIWQVGDWSSLETLSLSSNLLMEVNVANLTNLRTLDLRDNQLGSIPSSLGDLTNLQYLDLSANQLSGPIPSSLGNCTNLHTFYIADNQVCAPIPSSFVALQGLSVLDLSYNFLTGSIPLEFGGLTSLTHLVITNNPLGGNIPSTIANCSNLQSLMLSNISLWGVLSFEFHKLQSLQYLDLSSNNFNGNIWVLSNSTSLFSLDLGSNNFSGPIPMFSNCANLQDLRMSSNNFHGDISMLSNCTNLGDLYMGSNNFDGDISMLSNCTNIVNLNLSWNHFNGGIPETLLAHLSVIDLSGNQLSRAIPKLNGSLQAPNLMSLSLASNALEGEIPSWIWTLPFLFQLDLSNNFLEGNISHIEIVSLNFVHPRLRDRVQDNNTISFEDSSGMNVMNYQISDYFSVLLFGNGPSFVDLSNNFLSGEIPESFGNLQGLVFLTLDYNFFSGNIPKSMENCSSLKFLSVANNILIGNVPLWPLGLMLMDLSFNQLHGPIFSNLSNFTQLMILRLKYNYLSGSIILQFDRIQSLVSMVLSKNNFSGSIPKSLMNCSKLQFVDFSSNHFNGATNLNILNQLGDLRVLDLGFNDMEGEVPTWIWKLPKLQVLDLSHNRFHGIIPNNSIVLGGMRNVISNGNIYWTLQEHVDIIWDGDQLTFDYVRHDLTSLDLSSNNFSGAISSQFGELADLINLNLSNNLFNGILSETLGSIVALEGLDLSFNHLSGPLPSSLAKLSYLKTLKLGGNNFSGLIPNGKQFFTFNITSYRPGNQGLCGPPLKVCNSTPIRFFNFTTSRCVQDSKTCQYGSSFTNIVSIIALEIGISLGFLLFFANLVISRHIRHRFFGLIKLSDRRQFIRSYGLFRESGS